MSAFKRKVILAMKILAILIGCNCSITSIVDKVAHLQLTEKQAFMRIPKIFFWDFSIKDMRPRQKVQSAPVQQKTVTPTDAYFDTVRDKAHKYKVSVSVNKQDDVTVIGVGY